MDSISVDKLPDPGQVSMHFDSKNKVATVFLVEDYMKAIQKTLKAEFPNDTYEKHTEKGDHLLKLIGIEALDQAKIQDPELVAVTDKNGWMIDFCVVEVLPSTGGGSI